RCGVGQARVHDGKFCAIHHSLDNSLRVRVKVVARLEMHGKKKNELSIAVIGRGPIGSLPYGIAESRARRTNVGVAIVAANAPGLQNAVDKAFVAGHAAPLYAPLSAV